MLKVNQTKVQFDKVRAAWETPVPAVPAKLARSEKLLDTPVTRSETNVKSQANLHSKTSDEELEKMKSLIKNHSVFKGQRSAVASQIKSQAPL